MMAFLFSRAGAYVAVGAVVAALSLAVYVQHLKLAARDARIAKLEADVDLEIRVNKNQRAVIDGLTSDAAQAKRRATAAENALAAANAKTRTKTAAIVKEVERVQSPDDDAPLSPAMRAAVRGLRERFGQGRQ